MRHLTGATCIVAGVLAGVACLCCSVGVGLQAEWLLFVALGCGAASILLPVVVGLSTGGRRS